MSCAKRDYCTSLLICHKKFAHEEITHTLITYLARYEEFTSPDQLKRVVNLLHRQAAQQSGRASCPVSTLLRMASRRLPERASAPRPERKTSGVPTKTKEKRSAQQGRTRIEPERSHTHLRGKHQGRQQDSPQNHGEA